MSEAEALRTQAARLFARAIQARDQGNFKLADVMTAAAQRSVENATAIEAALAAAPQTRQQPVALQQQQIQPDKEPGKKE